MFCGRVSRWTRWIVASLLFSGVAGASGPILLQDGEYKFQLVTVPKTKVLHLYTLGSPKEPLPDELTATVFRSDGVVESVALKTLSVPWTGEGMAPTHSGKLDASAGSIIGVELRFSLRSGGSRTSRSIRWNEPAGARR